MAEIIKELGRVPISRGEFNLATTYYKDNIVQYHDASYQVTAESVTGVTPISPEGGVNTGWILFSGGPYAYRWKTTDTPASDGKSEGNLKDLYQKTLNLEQEQIQGDIYNISAINSGQTYSNLSEALGENGINIPVKRRQGGLNIKFINSSTNEYEQYCLLYPTWTIDPSYWSILPNTLQTNNLEWIDVKIDAKDKVLEGLRKDGTKVVGGDFNVNGSVTISNDATILGNVSIAGASYTICKNPEWIKVLVDSQGKILCGIKKNGKFVADVEGIDEFKTIIENLSNSVLLSDKRIKKFEEIFTIVEDNPEYIDIKTDSEDKILEATKVDGTKVISTNLELEGSISQQGVITKIVDNPEYIEVKVDKEGKFIEGINKKGEKIFGVIPPQIKQYIDNNISTGSGISKIEYDNTTGDMYAIYDDESGVTDVDMTSNGDIYVESEK